MTYLTQMLNNEELEKYKKIVQDIIDKYLPEDKRFSVKDFTQEWLYYLASLFLEKDPEKRKEIYKEIETKKKEAEKRFKESERNFLELNNEILAKKDEYDKIFNTINELNSLSDDVNIDQELDSNLDQF